LRNLYLDYMRNKLIILTFAVFICFTSSAQSSFEARGQETKVSIYPNPAVDILMVQIEGDVLNTTFELNSMIGNKVVIRPEKVGVGKYKIPVKDLTTGYYFLIIKDEEYRFKKAFKFLKH